MDHLQIELIDRCNIQCEFCIAKNNRTQKQLPIKKVYDILDQAKKLHMPGGRIWMVSFNGLGEPTLYPNLTDAVRYAKKLFPYVGFITNGLLMNESLSREVLNLDISYIVFSINGVEEDNYKKYQGYGFSDAVVSRNLHRVLNNIHTFLRLRDELGKKTQVRMSYILTEDSKMHFKKYVSYWKRTKKEILISVIRLMEDKKPNGNAKYFRCERIGEDFLISADGEVRACACDMLRGISLGNVYDFSLKEIMNGIRYKEIVRVHETMDLKNMPKGCLRCDKLIDRGFLKNDAVMHRMIYLNNWKEHIKWEIYSAGLNIFTEFKKHEQTYPLYRRVKRHMKLRETSAVFRQK